MKRISCLAAGLAALTMAPGAMACGRTPTYVRLLPPDEVSEDAIVAEVEMDLSRLPSLLDRGIRFRVRRMIQGEPAEFLITPAESCVDGMPGRAAGYIVATRVRRDGDTLVVSPVIQWDGLFPDAAETPPATR